MDSLKKGIKQHAEGQRPLIFLPMLQLTEFNRNMYFGTHRQANTVK